MFLKETEEICCPVSPLSNETISDITLEPCEVRVVLNNMNPNKASGPDKIPIRLLKECACSITPSLTYLFNKSLHTGDLPTEWKLFNIIPLHKNGYKNYVENYRPISLMCVVGKVLERCIYNRLIDHVRKLISDCQHGFVRGKSCTSQLLSVLNHQGVPWSQKIFYAGRKKKGKEEKGGKKEKKEKGKKEKRRKEKE